MVDEHGVGGFRQGFRDRRDIESCAGFIFHGDYFTRVTLVASSILIIDTSDKTTQTSARLRTDSALAEKHLSPSRL